MTPVDLTIFRHEFGTMFRQTRRVTVQARDIQILKRLDEASVLYDIESGVVFLSREMTNHLLRYTSPRRTRAPAQSRRRY